MTVNKEKYMLIVCLCIVAFASSIVVWVYYEHSVDPCAEYVTAARHMIATDGTPVDVERRVCLEWKPGRGLDGGVK